MPAAENDGFLGGSKPAKAAERDRGAGGGECLTSKGCGICAVITGGVGILLVLLGLLAVFAGEGFLEGAILKSMALTEGSDRTESWMRPPVTPYLSGYAFHIKNPDAVLRGKKPILEERGPYVYKSVTVKDADDNMVWGDGDGTLTYRARKLYTFVPEMSGPGLDPFKDTITVPNIPLWTGLHGLREKGPGMAMDIGRGIVTENGRGTPFVSVTFDGLLWGYEDELPCLRLDKPSECGGDSFADDDGWGDDDDGWGNDDWKRKKRSADDEEWKNPDLDPESEYYGLAKPKAEFVDCKCQWGLFRDRNVTMREPIKFLTGVTDLAKKGVVLEYNGKTELGWWKKGSACDAVGGQDSSTLPPGLDKDSKPNIFIDLLCRGMPFEFEKVS